MDSVFVKKDTTQSMEVYCVKNAIYIKEIVYMIVLRILLRITNYMNAKTKNINFKRMKF